MKKVLYALGMTLMGVLLFSACMNPLGEKAETGEALENRGLVEIQVGSAARTVEAGMRRRIQLVCVDVYN